MPTFTVWNLEEAEYIAKPQSFGLLFFCELSQVKSGRAAAQHYVITSNWAAAPTVLVPKAETVFAPFSNSQVNITNTNGSRSFKLQHRFSDAFL